MYKRQHHTWLIKYSNLPLLFCVEMHRPTKQYLEVVFAEALEYHLHDFRQPQQESLEIF